MCTPIEIQQYLKKQCIRGPCAVTTEPSLLDDCPILGRYEKVG